MERNKEKRTGKGGARKGAGRPPLFGKRQPRTSIVLPAEDIAFLNDLGAGNQSQAIRELIRFYKEHNP